MRRIILAGVVLAIFGAAGCGSASSPRPHTTATQTERREQVNLTTEFDMKHHTGRSTTTVSPMH